ncbi:MAG TPA: helix-turn-helix domain-containing protein [Acidimicrobiales bacterium]|nr:helix-turn-helix domain-containing protein [Acidimicrobiales bacterium]
MATAAELVRDAGGTHPGRGLQAVAALRRLLDHVERLHVDRARALGWTWQEVAGALGVTKQTVHRKHGGRFIPPRNPDP